MRQYYQFADISDILARKAAGRRYNASLSFAEKLAKLDEMKERVAPIVRARRTRRAELILRFVEQPPVG
jgi:hypothetical protein